MVKEKGLLLLKSVIENEEFEEEFEKIEDKFLELYEPTIYSGSKGYEVQSTLEFERLVHILSSHTTKDVKRMNLIEVNTLINKIKDESNKK